MICRNEKSGKKKNYMIIRIYRTLRSKVTGCPV